MSKESKLYDQLHRQRIYFYHMGLWESAEIINATLIEAFAAFYES